MRAPSITQPRLPLCKTARAKLDLAPPNTITLSSCLFHLASFHNTLGTALWLNLTPSRNVSMAHHRETAEQSLYHAGNGIPCRFFNKDTRFDFATNQYLPGCVNGAACAYSHAPTIQSLRLDLFGPNMCAINPTRFPLSRDERN